MKTIISQEIFYMNIMTNTNKIVFSKKQQCFTSYPTVLLDGVPLGVRGSNKKHSQITNTINIVKNEITTSQKS
jgi:hypothetical protein